MEHIPRVGTAYIGSAASRNLCSAGPQDPERAAAYQKEVQRLVDAWRPRVEEATGEEFEEWSTVDYVAVGSRRHVVKLQVWDPSRRRGSSEDEEYCREYSCIHLRIESGVGGKRASCGFALEKTLEDPLEDEEEDFESTDNLRSWLMAPWRLLTRASQCGKKEGCSCQFQKSSNGLEGQSKSSRGRGKVQY